MSMNLYQRFNVTATFAVAVSISNGISLAFTKSSNTSQSVIRCDDGLCISGHSELFLISVFSLLFNFKACFENYKFFEYVPKTDEQKMWRFAGFFLGLLSWISWIISGSISSIPDKCALWLAFAIFISTAWVVQHICELYRFRGSSGEGENIKTRVLWIIFNFLYIFILLAFVYHEQISSYISFIHVSEIPTLACLFVVFAADYIASRNKIALVGYDD